MTQQATLNVREKIERYHSFDPYNRQGLLMEAVKDSLENSYSNLKVIKNITTKPGEPDNPYHLDCRGAALVSGIEDPDLIGTILRLGKLIRASTHIKKGFFGRIKTKREFIPVPKNEGVVLASSEYWGHTEEDNPYHELPKFREWITLYQNDSNLIRVCEEISEKTKVPLKFQFQDFKMPSQSL